MSDCSVTSLETIELEWLKDDRLPFICDDVSLSLRLGFKPRTFWWLLLKPTAAYKKFEIRKASGKMRLIHNPSPTMRVLLKNVRRKFVLPLVEDLGPHVTAYRAGKGARDAVYQHIHDCPVCANHDVPHTCSLSYGATSTGYRLEKHGADCVACAQPPKHESCSRRGVKVHLDLQDFFSNTRAAWIRDFYVERVGYNYRAAELLAGILTTPVSLMHGKKRVTVRGVPQGASTSGDICNLVADHRLDGRVFKALEGTGWRYTRYADDLYFSHSENLPPEKVAALIGQVAECVKAAGWRINAKKICVQRPKYQQRLLGATLNRKLNVPNQEYRRIRTIIHHCWRDGFVAEAARLNKPNAAALKHWLVGKLSWFSSLNATKAERLKLVLAAALEKHDGQFADAA